MMKLVYIILIFVLCLIAACSQSYIVNMNENTKFPEGRELFASKCGGCHKLYNPDQFTSAEWDSLLFLMKRKAKIVEEQKNEIYKWINEVKENNAGHLKLISKPDNGN